ncbi:MAG: hypothetical protein VB141_13645 [Burkholderia gladioli]
MSRAYQSRPADDGGMYLLLPRDRHLMPVLPETPQLVMIDYQPTEGDSPMPTALSPLVSEFETAEQEASYTLWLRTKVAASLADPRPTIPHDQVMAEMDELIAQIEAEQHRKP